jgi:hypothetical protein
MPATTVEKIHSFFFQESIPLRVTAVRKTVIHIIATQATMASGMESAVIFTPED